MIKIGQYNELRVERYTDFGAYLTDGEGGEVLLPGRYCDPDSVVGDMLKVFVYTDSEDRPVATTEVPFATVGQFAYLQAVAVNKVGAFLDWGLTKTLMVPFREQKVKMHAGGIYLVYVYLDHATGRVAASARIERHLGNVYPDYKPGQEVSALIIEHTEIGYRVIVDNLHRGMIYDNETYQNLEVQQTVKAYVKHVREDGKIDLTMTEPGTANRVNNLGAEILRMVNEGGFELTDKSSPEAIKALLHCSKKDFKKAVGALYRERKIVITPEGHIKPSDNR